MLNVDWAPTGPPRYLVVHGMYIIWERCNLSLLISFYRLLNGQLYFEGVGGAIVSVNSLYPWLLIPEILTGTLPEANPRWETLCNAARRDVKALCMLRAGTLRPCVYCTQGCYTDDMQLICMQAHLSGSQARQRGRLVSCSAMPRSFDTS